MLLTTMSRDFSCRLETAVAAAMMLAGFWLLSAGQAAAPGAARVSLDTAVETDGRVTLAPGPKVEGVVFLQGGRWKDATVQTFNDIPWVDAASVRVAWAEFERQDQVFNWEPFDRLLVVVKKYNAREGTLRAVFRRPDGTKRIARVAVAADVPEACSVKCRARMRAADGGWGAWNDATQFDQLPAGDEVEIEATLHTDDGYYTPTIRELKPAWTP